MKILIKQVKDLLSKDLSLEERGLMITILLLKDSDPKLTLAKVRAKTNFVKNRDLVCRLQDKGFVEWSGYEAYKKSLEKKQLNPHIVEVVNYMNDTFGTRFNPKAKSTTQFLTGRLEEHPIEDVKLVIANRYLVWKDDKVMYKYLKPDTIFRPSKFDKYLEEAKRTHEGESILSVSKIGLVRGDKITQEIAKTLVKTEVYVLKSYSIINGKEASTGKIIKITGSNLISIFAAQKMAIDMGDEIEENYYYYGS